MPNERKLLRRVAILANGFTLDIAQAVASDLELDELAILDALGGLVEKSLVQVVGGDGDELPRYFLLETTRLYAVDQLSAAGETQALLERRGQVLATWAAEASKAFFETPELVWLQRCLPEWENVMTALDWAERTGAADQFVPLFNAAARIAPRGGDVVVFRRYIHTACSIARDVAPESAAQLLRSVGGCLALVSNRRALETFRAAVESARASGDRWLLYLSLVNYARLLASGSNLEAPKFTEAIIVEARGLEDPSWPKVVRGMLRHAEGGACAEGGDLISARTRYLEALRLYIEARSVSGARAAQLALLDIEARQGNDAEAIRLGEALAPAFRDSRGQVFFPIAILCALYARQGDLARARAAAIEALRVVRHQRLAVTVFAHIALFAAREGRVVDAARLLGYADASLRTNLHKFETLEEIFRHEALALIGAAMSQADLNALTAEGELLSDAEADAIAIGSVEDRPAREPTSG